MCMILKKPNLIIYIPWGVQVRVKCQGSDHLEQLYECLTVLRELSRNPSSDVDSAGRANPPPKNSCFLLNKY